MDDLQTALAHLACPLAGALIFVSCRGTVSPGALVPAVLALPAASLLMAVFLSLTIRLCPDVFDATLAQFDAALGFQPSAAAVRLLGACRPLFVLCLVVYQMLPLSAALSAAAEIRSGDVQGLGVLPTFCVAGIAGFCLYLYVPAVGPGPFFGMDLPLVLRPQDFAGTGPDVGSVARNCMPSLHATWAMLAFLATRRRGARVQAISGGFLVLTLLATLGFARHYLVDLVVAAPFVLLVRGVCAVRTPWERRRCTAVVLGAGLVLGWTTLVRSGPPGAWLVPLVPVAMVVTVLAAAGCEAWLAAGERASCPAPGHAGPAGGYARLISTRARAETARQAARSGATP